MESYWRVRFNELDSTVILAYERSRYNFELRLSTIPHTGDVIFKTGSISANKVVGYFYGTLSYKNLSIVSSRRPAKYGEGSLAVPVKDVTKLALQLQCKTAS